MMQSLSKSLLPCKGCAATGCKQLSQHWRRAMPIAASQVGKGNPFAACPARCIQPSRLHSASHSAMHPSASAAVSEAETSSSIPATAPSAVQPEPAFRAFVDFKFVRDNLDLVVANCRNRNSLAQPELVVQLYDDFVRLQTETDAVRKARNDNSAAMKAKLGPQERQQLVEAGKQLKEQLVVLEAQLGRLEERLQLEGQRLPNLTHPDVPVGGEEAATLLREVGRKQAFTFEVKDHVQLGQALDLIDFETAAAVAGAKFYYLRNAAALLEVALVSWTLGRLVPRGFTPVITPDVVRESVLEKCGFQPRGDNTQVYSIRDTQLCLTGTAEVPLGGVYMDRILPEAQLPIKMAAFGRCFRTEAGAAGSASKGLYRVHQFSKVEMFVVCTPEQSNQLHQELIDIEIGLFSELGLHFQVLDMPTCDLGAPAYRKFDVEAWMPGMGRYGEISSASNCTDYQSRRLNIRYRPGKDEEGQAGKGKKVATQFAHTLNATACAVPRMIVAILENFQQEDGSVVVPEVLRPYLGGLHVIAPQQHPSP